MRQEQSQVIRVPKEDSFSDDAMQENALTT